MRHTEILGILKFGLLALVAFLALGAFNLYADPYHFFRRDNVYTVTAGDQRYMIAGMTRTTDPFDILLVGSSLVSNFDADLISKELGGKAWVASFWGMNTDQAIAVTEHAMRWHPSIKTVLFEAPVYQLCFVDKNAVPREAYLDLPTAEIAYLTSWDVTVRSWQKLTGSAPNMFGGPTEQSVYQWWRGAKFGDLPYLERQALVKNAPAVAVAQPEAAVASRTALRTACIDKLFAFTDQHPDTQFMLIDPPVSQWWQWYRSMVGLLPEYLKTQEMIAEMAAARRNVRYFDFYPSIPQTGECRHYRDQNHFDLEVADQIVRWIAEGKYERTPQNNAEMSAASIEAAKTKMACS